MRGLFDLRYRKISHNATVNDLLKESFRKSIHFCAAFVPILASVYFSFTVIALSIVICLYIICEYRRLAGKPIPLISRITVYAARKRDEGHFVLGPITLAFGVLSSLLFFPLEIARVGIFALAFGDGIASLAGKIYGRVKLPYTHGKSLEGSAACFVTVYVSTIICTVNPLLSLEVALLAMIIEMLPLKDYDNLLIPLLINVFLTIVYF